MAAKLSHHKQEQPCTSRPSYRNPRQEKAVKVYTINQESKYLLVFNVPSLGVVKELLELFSLHGKIEEYRLLDEYPCEEYTDVYLVKYRNIESSRHAKKSLDNYYFYSKNLHICYGPEYESVNDVREKLEKRRQYVLQTTTQKATHQSHPPPLLPSPMKPRPLLQTPPTAPPPLIPNITPVQPLLPLPPQYIVHTTNVPPVSQFIGHHQATNVPLIGVSSSLLPLPPSHSTKSVPPPLLPSPLLSSPSLSSPSPSSSVCVRKRNTQEGTPVTIGKADHQLPLTGDTSVDCTITAVRKKMSQVFHTTQVAPPTLKKRKRI